MSLICPFSIQCRNIYKNAGIILWNSNHFYQKNHESQNFHRKLQSEGMSSICPNSSGELVSFRLIYLIYLNIVLVLKAALNK